MPRCDLCNRDFKNGAGLAGHYQLKHASERSLEGFDPSAVAASKRPRSKAFRSPRLPVQTAWGRAGHSALRTAWSALRKRLIVWLLLRK